MQGKVGEALAAWVTIVVPDSNNVRFATGAVHGYGFPLSTELFPSPSKDLVFPPSPLSTPLPHPLERSFPSAREQASPCLLERNDGLLCYINSFLSYPLFLHYALLYAKTQIYSLFFLYKPLVYNSNMLV